MIGKTVSHYRIIARIGEGGMGVVYRAEDTRLHRDIAIKFLPPQLSSDENAKRRFIREARAASALNHANIAVVHEIDETTEGQLFMVMALYEGGTLKDRMQGAALGLNEAITIVSQVAAGLARAHEKGILHRDVKPANILMGDDGQAKIADFGLATLAGQTKITRTGTTVGTVAYMSPEQARGDELDAASDVFSLGIVLYELIAGRLPFPGYHEAAVLYGIVNSEPPPLAATRDDIPDSLQAVVDRCLRKSALERYRDAGELLADLNRLQAGAPVTATVNGGMRRRRRRVLSIAAVSVVAAGVLTLWMLRVLPFNRHPDAGSRKMIAVLPFENLGPPGEAYFADGITDEITARLAMVNGLGVIARTSTMQYKGRGKDIREIGQELGVDYVLEGTIRWERTDDGGSTVRVTPQLVDASDAAHLWADIYDEPMTELFETQTDIAMKVVAALNVSLSRLARDAITSRPTDNLDAYDNYLRGNEYFNEGTAEYRRFIAAAEFFEQAVELDPSFAEAYAKLSGSKTEIYWHLGKDEKVLNEAIAAMNRAIKLKPQLPEAHQAFGSFYYHKGENKRALREYDKALEGRPTDSEILLEMGFVYRRMGEYRKALERFKEAALFDPLSGVTLMHVGLEYERFRDYDQAETVLNQAIHLDPTEPMMRAFLANLFVLRNGDTTTALQVLKEAATIVPIEGLIANIWITIDILTGDYTAALKRLEADVTPDQSQIAYVYHLMGDEGSAREHYHLALARVEEDNAGGDENAMKHIRLGLVFAGLERAKDAVAEADRAGELAVPWSQGSEEYLYITTKRARIYALAGEHDKALDLLERLLSLDGFISKSSVRLEPWYASLHNEPRYKTLVGD